MSEIDYYNGFVCGMATRGVIKSGQSYSPNAFNDPGQTGYFYIEFRQSLNSFSFGMLAESIQVLGSAGTLSITGFKMISPSRMQVFCNIDGQQAVTVIGKTGGWLSFTAGGKVPGFSVSFDVEGVVSYPKLAYAYEALTVQNTTSQVESATIDFANYTTDQTAYDMMLIPAFSSMFEDVVISFYQL